MPSPLTTTWVVRVLEWPSSLTTITSVSWCGWPEASCAGLGQMMLPDLIVTDVVPTWVSGTEIDPSLWTMKTEVVPVCRPSRSSLTFMATLSPPAAGDTESTLLLTVPESPFSFSWYTQVPDGQREQAGAPGHSAARRNRPVRGSGALPRDRCR